MHWYLYSRGAPCYAYCSLTFLVLAQSLTRLLKAYDTSLKSGKLSEKMCKRYLDTLKTLKHARDALTTSTLATNLYPQAVELWQCRLSIVAAASEGGVGGAMGVRTRRSKVTKKTGGGGGVGEVCREALDKVPKKVGVTMYTA